MNKESDLGTDKSTYLGYEAWKCWENPFTFTADEAADFEGECRNVQIAGAKVFEIGFGSGNFLAWAQGKGANVAGSEINPASIEGACSQGIELLPPTFENVAEAHADRFDTVVGFDVFERVRVRFADTASVRCIPFAFSNVPGRDRLAIASATGGTNSLSFDESLARQAHTVSEVQKSTVAEFCKQNEIEHIHLLKCDTEGHDLRVIEGAKPLLAAERIDVFQFEYNHRWIYERAFLKDVFDIVADMPYTIAAMRSSRIELLHVWHPELDRFFEASYLIVHERALGWFNVQDGRFDVSNTYARPPVRKKQRAAAGWLSVMSNDAPARDRTRIHPLDVSHLTVFVGDNTGRSTHSTPRFSRSVLQLDHGVSPVSGISR